MGDEIKAIGDKVAMSLPIRTWVMLLVLIGGVYSSYVWSQADIKANTVAIDGNKQITQGLNMDYRAMNRRVYKVEQNAAVTKTTIQQINRSVESMDNKLDAVLREIRQRSTVIGKAK